MKNSEEYIEAVEETMTMKKREQFMEVLDGVTEENAKDTERTKRVCDYIYSKIEYALSSEMKEKYLHMTPGLESYKLLQSLGGSVWKVHDKLNLIEDYKLAEEMISLQAEIDGYRFALAENPMQALEAGYKLGMNVDENVLHAYDFDGYCSLLVYHDDVLVDVVHVNTDQKEWIIFLNNDFKEPDVDPVLRSLEKYWAEMHGLEIEKRLVISIKKNS